MTELTAWEELQKSRRKLAKYNRKAMDASVGAKYQEALIKVRKWEKLEEYWFEQWQRE